MIPTERHFILGRTRFNNPLSPAAEMPRLETWSDKCVGGNLHLLSPNQRFRRAPNPSNPVSRQLSNTLQQDLYTRFPSRVPPNLSPAGAMYEIFNNVFLDLYHPQQYLGSRLGQIVHRRNQSYHSSLPQAGSPPPVIPKQNIRVFFKMDMF